MIAALPFDPAAYLARQPWCRPCARMGRVARATEVLHPDDAAKREPVCGTCYEVGMELPRRTKPCGCGP